MTAIWMLNAFTADNGATRVVPGTQLLLHPVPRRFAQAELTIPTSWWSRGRAEASCFSTAPLALRHGQPERRTTPGGPGKCPR